MSSLAGIVSVEDSLVTKVKNLFLEVLSSSHHLIKKDFNDDGKDEIMLCSKHERSGTIFYLNNNLNLNYYTSEALNTTHILSSDSTSNILTLVKTRKYFNNSVVFFYKDKGNPEYYYSL